MARQITQAGRMKTDIDVTAEDRVLLERLVADRNTPAKVVWRAQIVLASADGKSVKAIARATGKSKPCVWRWQRRFAEAGVEGLKRDKTRPPGRKQLAPYLKAKVLAKTASETPPDATHWSVRAGLRGGSMLQARSHLMRKASLYREENRGPGKHEPRA